MSVCTLHTTPTPKSPKTNPEFNQRPVIFYTNGSRMLNRRRTGYLSCSAEQQTAVIGLAADSGCGKSTFMRRLTSVFGGAAEPPKGGNSDSNTLISDTTTVICLDYYHSQLDRTGRKREGCHCLGLHSQKLPSHV